MWSDMLTKPLAGLKSKVMRSKLMNCAVEYDDAAEAAITHPDLLPKVDPLPVDTGETLKKAELTARGPKPKQVGALNKRVELLKDLASRHTGSQLPTHRRSVLSEVKLASLNTKVARGDFSDFASRHAKARLVARVARRVMTRRR